jgi:diacylglycerol kinase (ATP)
MNMIYGSILLLSSAHMRAAAILGLGCSAKNLKPFQSAAGERTTAGEFPAIEWRMGVPATGDHVDVVLLFGGDGTIHRHLGQLVKLGLPLLVVPAGSGNDFARALGLRRVRDALAAWQKFCSGGDNVRPLDLGMITPVDVRPADVARAGSNRDSALGAHYFAGVAGIGLDGEVARRANKLPRWLRGQGGYVLSLAPAVFAFAAQPMKILIPAQVDVSESAAENKVWATRSHQPTLLAAFANTPFYGGGMKIAPQARPDDGLLDVCIVGGVDPFKLFCMFPTVYAGRHLRIREVDYFQSARARVETERPLDVYADGEYVCQTPVELSSQRAALRVLTP